MKTKKSSYKAKYENSRSLSKEEVDNLSNKIQSDNTRLVGFGRFRVDKDLVAKGKSNLEKQERREEEFKKIKFKEWKKLAKGLKTGDDLPLDTYEAFEQHFDDFIRFIKETELDEQEQRFKEFTKENKGKKGRAAILALSSCLRWATYQSPKITALQLNTLFCVALQEGEKLAYYVDQTGQPKSTVSRHMLEMGAETEKYKGLDWIEVQDHPTDSRSKTFHLTEKGKQFIKHIEQQLDMPYEESSLLSSILGLPINSSGGATMKVNAEVVKAQKEVSDKYGFLK